MKYTKTCRDCGEDMGIVDSRRLYCDKCREKKNKETQKKAAAKFYSKVPRKKKYQRIKEICECGKRFEYVYISGAIRKKCDECRAKDVEAKQAQRSYIKAVMHENKELKEFIKTELLLIKNEIEILKEKYENNRNT